MKERDLHGYTADLLRLMARPGVLWLHIANEGARSPRTGAYLKRMGMRPGAADFLIVRYGHAYFLELKTGKGRLSPAQLVFRADTSDAGCPYSVCRSPEEVRETLDGWGAIRSVSPVVRETAAA